MGLKKLIGRTYLRLSGWKAVGPVPDFSTRNYIQVSTPHTSNLDFWVGLMVFWAYGARPLILIKKEAFKGIKGWFLRRMGAIPVDRQGSSRGLIQQLRKIFSEETGRLLVITPEGTRKRGGNWKTGFYFLSRACKVDILLGWVNYRDKEAAFGELFTPTGDKPRDFAFIRDYYAQKPAIGRYPEQGHQELWPEGEGLDRPEFADPFAFNKRSAQKAKPEKEALES